jgi:hypothetical protein
MSAAIYSAAFLTSQFFQLVYGDSPLATGVRFLPWTATPLLIAPVAGAISDRVRARVLMVPGLLLQGAGFAWIVALAGSHAGNAAYPDARDDRTLTARAGYSRPSHAAITTPRAR